MNKSRWTRALPNRDDTVRIVAVAAFAALGAAARLRIRRRLPRLLMVVAIALIADRLRALPPTRSQ